MATLRVLRTSKATLTKTLFLDEAGTDATGNVVVTVTRLDGTAVESGNATGPDANHQYSYLFGGRDLLDELVVTWAATVSGDAVVLDQDRLQVVGGFLFSLTEGRSADPVLSNMTTYPTATLVEKRVRVETDAERICGQAFVPRFRRRVLDGTGHASLPTGDPWLRAVRAITVTPPGGVAAVWSAGQLANVIPGDDGTLTLVGGWWPYGRRNVIAEYEYGLDTPPVDVADVSKTHFKSLLLARRSPLPDRAERIAVTDLGTVLLAQPVVDKTGLPEVDAVYARHPPPIPGFG